jgi:tRNA A-37 threonylcarbamoyl transferase component Bud32
MLGRVFLDRYETIRLLGEGGMGRVYLARQLDLGRQVVVKVMHDHIAADPTFRERFTRETLLMARFQHPYAVTLYDASLNDPQGPCIVMEYIRGVTLDQLLERHGRLSPARVGRLLYMICEVLQAAHAEGIIHRDLKPANLMVVDPDTPHEMIKVMDFGLAKLVAPGPMRHATVTNLDFAIGTPGYMCPEQARGEEMDHRGDLYSIGVVVFEMLCGRQPFSGAATMDVLLAQVTQDAPTFAQIGAPGLVPAPIERVVRACMDKDPEKRPRQARGFAEMYEQALYEAESALPHPAEPADGPARRPNRPSAGELPLPRPQVAGGRPSSGALIDARPAGNGAVVAARPTAACEGVAIAGPPDPLAVVFRLDAWMPEGIAAYKLHGFVQDAGGEVLESLPGKIRVLIRTGGLYQIPTWGAFGWLGLNRKSRGIELELHLQRPVAERENQLLITVHFRAPSRAVAADTSWRDLCTQIFCDLRAYLMGQTHPVGPEPN